MINVVEWQYFRNASERRICAVCGLEHYVVLARTGKVESFGTVSEIDEAILSRDFGWYLKSQPVISWLYAEISVCHGEVFSWLPD